MSDEATKTLTLTLAGRKIMFKRASLGQILILERTTKRMISKAEGDPEDHGRAMVEAVIKTLDFVETLIVSEQDRQFVEAKMLEGEIDYLDVIVALGGQDDPVPDDEEPKPVKKAPRKSPKAAPVDLTGKKPAQIVAKPVKAATRARTKR